MHCSNQPPCSLQVVTPNIYNFDLWKTSGHAAHYKDNMFVTHVEKAEFGLKPMNCPGAFPTLLVQCSCDLFARLVQLP